MKKTKKKFNPIPKFAIGDIIKHPRYGIGIIRQIDSRMYPSYEFFYNADFSGRKGDGTKAWLPKIWSEKNCDIIKQAIPDDGPACEGTGPDCEVPCPGVDNCKLCKTNT